MTYVLTVGFCFYDDEYNDKQNSNFNSSSDYNVVVSNLGPFRDIQDTKKANELLSNNIDLANLQLTVGALQIKAKHEPLLLGLPRYMYSFEHDAKILINVRKEIQNLRNRIIEFNLEPEDWDQHKKVKLSSLASTDYERNQTIKIITKTLLYVMYMKYPDECMRDDPMDDSFFQVRINEDQDQNQNSTQICLYADDREFNMCCPIFEMCVKRINDYLLKRQEKRQEIVSYLCNKSLHLNVDCWTVVTSFMY